MNYRGVVHFTIGVVLIATLILFSQALADIEPTLPSAIKQCRRSGNSLSLPVIFTENLGQWPDDIKFRARCEWDVTFFYSGSGFIQFFALPQ